MRGPNKRDQVQRCMDECLFKFRDTGEDPVFQQNPEFTRDEQNKAFYAIDMILSSKPKAEVVKIVSEAVDQSHVTLSSVGNDENINILIDAGYSAWDVYWAVQYLEEQAGTANDEGSFSSRLSKISGLSGRSSRMSGSSFRV